MTNETRLASRRTLAAGALALLLVTAGCIGQAAPGALAGGSADRTVRVSATGSVEAEPDRAVVQVSIVEYGETAPEARQALAENVSRLQQSLREAGIDEEQVTTARYDLRYDDDIEGAGIYEGYRAVHGFAITVEDLNRTGTVIDAAVAGGAARVQDVRFGLSTAHRRELKTRALEDATDVARGKAETLAAQSDLRIVGVDSVNAVGVDTDGRYVADAAYTTAAAGGAPTRIATGPVSVTTSVVVTYNATAA
jgi:hypothetical protein